MDLPICDQCGERPANILLKKIVDSQASEAHLCEDCAKAVQSGNGLGALLSVGKLLGDMLGGGEHVGVAHPPIPPGTAGECESCGLTYREFVTNGRFGCPQCYAAFDFALPTLVGHVQGGHARHEGRVPPVLRERVRRNREQAELRRRLKEAVENEQYEVAAELHREIRQREAAGEPATHGNA